MTLKQDSSDILRTCEGVSGGPEKYLELIKIFGIYCQLSKNTYFEFRFAEIQMRELMGLVQSKNLKICANEFNEPCPTS